jgi:hypothetical protein
VHRVVDISNFEIRISNFPLCLSGKFAFVVWVAASPRCEERELGDS